jgi:hypothetical protein
VRQSVAKKPKKIPAFFYQSGSGAEPVRDWLKGLDDEDKQTIGEDIATVEFSWPVGMPTCRSLGGGLWEVRSSLPSKREARIIFAVNEECCSTGSSRRRRKHQRAISIWRRND